jgi:hypothetical protein
MSFHGALLGSSSISGTPFNGSGITYGRGEWSPSQLFQLGEVGVWYDPSDISTLFTDTAGTTQVTAAGQEVARINDKSGRGNHATQATLAARPIYRIDAGGRPYLEFDGTDDGMATSAIDFTATDAVAVHAGVRKVSDAASAALVELSAIVASNAGSFILLAPAAAVANYMFRSRGDGSQRDASYTNAAVAAPVTNVLTGIADISDDSLLLRVNGAQVASSAADQGAGNFGNYPLYIGRRGGTSQPLNGWLYGLIVRGAASSDAQIANAERWLARKTGVSL